MNRPAPMAAYAALYAPGSEELRRLLPGVGEALATQLAEASRCPSQENLDQLTATLSGAQVMVRKFREALAREGGAA